jgi:hypothetical protein
MDDSTSTLFSLPCPEEEPCPEEPCPEAEALTLRRYLSAIECNW